MTAVEWLIKEITTKHDKSFIEFYGAEIEQAKQMEADQQYETKAFWFGRGILANKEDRISELKPTKNYNHGKRIHPISTIIRP